MVTGGKKNESLTRSQPGYVWIGDKSTMSTVGNRLHKIVVGTLIVGTVYAGVNLSYNLAFGWDRFHESQAVGVPG